ncbi:MAG: hypothetical protein ACYCZ6_10940 [Polaromonas sp.]
MSDFEAGFAYSDTTGEIRDVGAKTGGARFDNNQILHWITSLFQTRLFEHTAQRAWWYFDIWFTGNRYCARLRFATHRLESAQ